MIRARDVCSCSVLRTTLARVPPVRRSRISTSSVQISRNCRVAKFLKSDSGCLARHAPSRPLTSRESNRGVCAPRGFVASALGAGIKNPDDPRLDLALIYSKHPCSAAGTFTTNRVKAAPVKVSQAYLKADKVQAIVANSGNANACTGVEGISDARKIMSHSSPRELGLRPAPDCRSVPPASSVFPCP